MLCITNETINNARDYIPASEKKAFVEMCAERCFDRLQLSISGKTELPPIYKENSYLKSNYLLCAFANMYLGLEVENNEWLLDDAKYDEIASSHLFMQIERLKRAKDALITNKCYDLLSDYRLLEKWFSAEIDGLKEGKNDIVARQAIMSETAVKELPEIMEAVKEITKAKKEG